MEFPRQGLFIVQIEHDDWCLVWSTKNPANCNCNPRQSFIEVTDENTDAIAEKLTEDTKELRRFLQAREN